MSQTTPKVITRSEKSDENNIRSILWLVVASIMWGTVGVSSALLNRIEQTPALTVGFLRLAFSSPFLLVLAYYSIGRNPLKFRWRDLPIFAGMGVAMAGYQLFYFAAIPISSVTLVVVIALCSAPVLVALLSIPIFRERLTLQVLGSLILALGGTLLLAFGGGNGSETLKDGYLLGALLALGAGFSYSSFTILSKLATRHTTSSGPQTVAVSFTIGALIILPLAIMNGNLKLDLQPGVWLIAAYMGLVPTGLAYLIFLRSLRSISATIAAIITLLEPAVAALLAWLVLGEKVTLLTLVGATLLIFSVWLLSVKK
jgi:DME family drug/metabolite transporter